METRQTNLGAIDVRTYLKAIHPSLALVLLLTLGCLNASAIRVPAQTRQAAPDYSPLIADLKIKIPQLMALRHTPGLAIAFVDGDKLIWAEGFGFTDDSKKSKVTADTIFSLQSISKTYTASAFLIAASKGKLKLDEPVRKYWPGFSMKSRFGSDEASKITFRHLLSHWAGIPVEAPLGNNFDDCACTFEDHIKSLADSWLIAPVGDRYSYSNPGVDLAGYVLALRERKPFAQFMKEILFDPLGMKASTFDQQEALKSASFAQGHMAERELPDTYIPNIPSGGMYSNVTDMARFLSFQLAGARVAGKRLISAKLVKEMATIQFPAPGQVAGYGLGLAIQPWYGATFLSHAGSGYGYSTQQYWMPEYQIGVVVLTNAQSGSLSSDIADRVMLKMIEAKKGSVPPNQFLAFADKPAVTLEPNLLRRFEGTYKSRFNLVTFEFAEGNLFYVSGNTRTKLNGQSPTEFTTQNRRFVFRVNAEGKPTGVMILNPFQTEFLPFNDSPNDPPGANKSEWQTYSGDYQALLYGNPVATKVYLKNGYLYVDWQGGLKLTEYQTGLFFTTEGESVGFEGNRLLLGNRRFEKKR